jgi:putative membrane protein
MTTKFFRRAVIITVELLSFSICYAQTTQEETQAFLIKCANERMADVEEGKLAAERSTSPYIKEYGTRMVTDHSMLLEKIKELASLKNVALPQTISSEKQNDTEALRKEEAETFDYRFIRTVKVDRKKDIDLFKEATKSTDAEISAFARQYLLLLESQLEGIKQVRKAEDQAARLASIPQD